MRKNHLIYLWIGIVSLFCFAETVSVDLSTLTPEQQVLANQYLNQNNQANKPAKEQTKHTNKAKRDKAETNKKQPVQDATQTDLTALEKACNQVAIMNHIQIRQQKELDSTLTVR